MPQAKGVLGDTPADIIEPPECTGEVPPCIKIRVMASYVILTLLSAYAIYDYRIRPDCLCRPRPYYFAIMAFGITLMYGLLGIVNRVCPKQCPASLNSLIYFLEMSVVLPCFTSEAWTVAKMCPKYPEMVHLPIGAAVPGLACYFMQSDQTTWIRELSLAYSFFTLIYIGLIQNALWAALTGVFYILGYVYAERSCFMPRIDFVHDEEIINYCLSGFLLAADQYLL